MDQQSHPGSGMIYFSDVDVVLKLARCGFLPDLPRLLGVDEAAIQVHHLASLRSRIKRLRSPEHQQALVAFCERHQIIRGTGDVAREQAMLDAGMDPGEALLFAEAETTGGIVVTGDKRALLLYSKISTPHQRARIKVVCWEQLLLRVHQISGYEELKRGGCEGIAEDGLLRIAFSNGPATPEDHALAAIHSYLSGVRVHSGDVLVVFSD